MTPKRFWARLRTDLNVRPRRGAWYGVEKLGPVQVILDVAGDPVEVTRTFLDVVSAPPELVGRAATEDAVAVPRRVPARGVPQVRQPRAPARASAGAALRPLRQDLRRGVGRTLLPRARHPGGPAPSPVSTGRGPQRCAESVRRAPRAPAPSAPVGGSCRRAISESHQSSRSRGSSCRARPAQLHTPSGLPR